jgi:hypothetical protein
MLHSLSVDDVLRHTLDNKRSYRSEDSLDGSSYFDQNGISPRMDDSKENIRSPSKISLVDSHVSDRRNSCIHALSQNGHHFCMISHFL